MTRLDYTISSEQLQVDLSGDYLDFNDDTAKSRLFAALEKKSVREISFKAENLKKWDSTLVVILFEAAEIAKKRNLKLNLNALPKNLQQLLHLALSVDRKPNQPKRIIKPFLDAVGSWGVEAYRSFNKGLAFCMVCLHSLGRFFASKAIMRKVDFLFALEDSSYRAIGIVSLVSFMVGLILAFVGSIQLRTFGAQIYVANLVAIGMTRIMGAIMVGIIMAGRTGASYAATIGTMQVNEEIDALRTMGISTSDFLILPRMLSLVITMPFLVLLADFMGILGGGVVGVFMLNISLPEYYKYTLTALNMTNFWVGVFHGFVYAFVISLCGCYYGINSGRNADSVGVATTRAVVSAIVWMIVVTGILTWIFEALKI